MSNDIKILHEWSVSIDQMVNETNTENVNGQMLPVTRPVKKPVITRMALRELRRKERREMDLFPLSRVAFYTRPPHSLLLASELTNRLINTTGGVMTDQEKTRVEKLREEHVALDNQLALSIHATPETKVELQKKLAGVRSQLIDLSALNEALYNQTAEAMANADLLKWIEYRMVVIHRDGKWVPYFEGDTWEKQEEFQYTLEDKRDEFYLAAAGKIAAFAYWFSRGAESPEAFKLMEEEMEKQAAARKAADEKAADEKAAKEAKEAKIAAEQVVDVSAPSESTAEPASVV